MIDLHSHTNYSDGTWDVETLLKNAETMGVEVLAITDHDNVKVHKYLKNIDYSKIFTGKIIVGGEFNAIYNNAKIELLGYNFDIDKIDKLCSEIYSEEKVTPDLNKEFRLLMDACHKNNIKVDDIDYNPSMGWPIDYIYPSIKKYEENKKYFTDKEWNDIDHFFRCCTCNIDFPLYMDFSYQVPNAKIVSDAIRNSGGKVFIAHLFIYPLRDSIAYLDKLREDNIIDGVEVYHSSFTEDEIKILEEYCKKHNLYMSGGSDCHGDKKPDRKIGIGYGNLNITKEIVKDWINN